MCKGKRYSILIDLEVYHIFIFFLELSHSHLMRIKYYSSRYDTKTTRYTFTCTTRYILRCLMFLLWLLLPNIIIFIQSKLLSLIFECCKFLEFCKTNPCMHGGICNKADGSCSCPDGCSGIICENCKST